MNTQNESWPPEFDEAKRERVLKHVMWYYADRDVATALQDDLVTFPEAPERGPMALGNVAAKCAGASVTLWTTIIDLHLDELERLRLNQPQLSENLADYDDIAEALAVQARLDELHELTRVRFSREQPTMSPVLAERFPRRCPARRGICYHRRVRIGATPTVL